MASPHSTESESHPQLTDELSEKLLHIAERLLCSPDPEPDVAYVADSGVFYLYRNRRGKRCKQQSCHN